MMDEWDEVWIDGNHGQNRASLSGAHLLRTMLIEHVDVHHMLWLTTAFYVRMKCSLELCSFVGAYMGIYMEFMEASFPQSMVLIRLTFGYVSAVGATVLSCLANAEKVCFCVYTWPVLCYRFKLYDAIAELVLYLSDCPSCLSAWECCKVAFRPDTSVQSDVTWCSTTVLLIQCM